MKITFILQIGFRKFNTVQLKNINHIGNIGTLKTLKPIFITYNTQPKTDKRSANGRNNKALSHKKMSDCALLFLPIDNP